MLDILKIKNIFYKTPFIVVKRETFSNLPFVLTSKLILFITIFRNVLTPVKGKRTRLMSKGVLSKRTGSGGMADQEQVQEMKQWWNEAWKAVPS